ncbi:MAG TPA: DUF6660 family protein [Dyadobacter sp.]|jgi:hypothetical protein|nr:DUF6660 family protein [Dyadobacter sp.]
MKLSLIILALYIGILSCFPCQDGEVHLSLDGNVSTEVVHNESDHPEHGGDYCSPLCICSCCATVTMPPMFFGLSLPKSLPATPEKSFQYKASFDQANAGLIWQPPRLV